MRSLAEVRVFHDSRLATQRPAILIKGKDQKFVTVRSIRDYLDEEGLTREISEARRTLSLSKSIINVRLNSLPILDDKAKEWDRMRDEIAVITYFLATSDEKIVDKKSKGEPQTYKEFRDFQTLFAGGTFLSGKIIEKQLQYAKKHGFIDDFETFSKLFEFTVITGAPHSIKVNGVSLKDIMSKDEGVRVSSFDVFRFLVDTAVAFHQNSPQNLLMGEQNELFTVYPNMALLAAKGLGRQMIVILSWDRDKLKNFVKQNTGISRIIASSAEEIIERIISSSEDFYNQLISPTSKDFRRAKEIVQEYLKDRTTRVVMLHMATLGSESKLSNLYRKAVEYTGNGIDSEFYKNLQQAILSYMNDEVENPDILTYEDAELLLMADEEPEEKSKFSLDDFGRLASRIFSKSSVREYTLEPHEIEWGNLISPKEIHVSFDRPHKFKVKLAYEAKTSETDVSEEMTDVSLEFDISKKHFDWNFLESQNDPSMQAMKATTWNATYNLLNCIAIKVEAAYTEKQKLRNKEPNQNHVKKPQRERTTDEIYTLRKEVKEEARSREENRMMELITSSEQEEIKKKINLPEKDILEKMLAKLGFVDRKMVLDAIVEFNEKRIGEFTRKKRKNKDGETLYTLRVNCTVPKGARVLVYETESSEGIRNFEIIDIDYRRNIYRRAGIN